MKGTKVARAVKSPWSMFVLDVKISRRRWNTLGIFGTGIALVLRLELVLGL